MSKRSSLPGSAEDEPEPERIDQKLIALDLCKRFDGHTGISEDDHTKRPRKYNSVLHLTSAKPPSSISSFTCSVLDKVHGIAVAPVTHRYFAHRLPPPRDLGNGIASQSCVSCPSRITALTHHAPAPPHRPILNSRTALPGPHCTLQARPGPRNRVTGLDPRARRGRPWRRTRVSPAPAPPPRRTRRARPATPPPRRGPPPSGAGESRGRGHGGRRVACSRPRDWSRGPPLSACTRRRLLI